MMSSDAILDAEQRVADVAKELAALLRVLPEHSFQGPALERALIEPLLSSIQDPCELANFASIGSFFKARRDRLSFVERLRVAIHRAYAFSATTQDGKRLYVSVSAQQWFDDGVMHVEGEKPHEGMMLLLQGTEMKVATAARDAKEGEELGPDDFRYIPMSDANERQNAMAPSDIVNIDQPLRELEQLMARRETDETRYQELFERYPWVLGAQYSQAFRHKALDHENIPDFLARRSRDGRHDIIEIKPPFLELARSDGSPNAVCREAIAQCLRYLDFARTNTAYLAERRLIFDAPEVWLIAGHRVSDAVRAEFRTHQRCNPALHIVTYDDLLTYMRGTIGLLQGLRDASLRAATDSAPR